MNIEGVLQRAPVIPVVAIEDPSHALIIAQGLIKGGLPIIEVTLRTPAAFEAIKEIAKLDEILVGAGTVLNEAQLDQALVAGAEFVVSPGLTDALGRAAVDRQVAYLPGVASASDIMRGLDFGFSCFKFFPAEANGGIAALEALSKPFDHLAFCPTGGITQQNAAEWLAVPNVVCVGGSWIVPKGPPQRDAITKRASMAMSLRRTD